MERKRREDSFFGLHFDFHATPESVTAPVGGRLTEELIREICETVKPDFLQIDCKGHPGWASYPSRLGNGVQPMDGDPLKLWRKVTAECGVALYMHYSGVIDHRWCAEHPDQVAIGPDGKAREGMTSVFGTYADDLLIPQLKELAGEYGVDGIWIDGECWGTDTDFNPKVLKLFEESTGVQLNGRLPATREDPYYQEFRDFCREGFRKYLRHYVDELHKVYPQFQIASNWAFTDHMPEPVSADVDFLSGDYSPQDSLTTARYCGRIIEAQDMPWDLMAWNFRNDFSGSGLHCRKEPEQIKQEAAAVLSLGGGFQDYLTQLKDGTPRLGDVKLLRETAEFCRARQPWCHKGRIVPQAVLFHSRHNQYLLTERLFHNSSNEPLRGWTELLCETQQSFDIRSEHNFLDSDPNRFPFAVISDIEVELDAESAEKLLRYAADGGSLLVSGPKALRAMIDAGVPVSVTEKEGRHHFSPDGRSWAWSFGSVPELAAPGARETLIASGDMSGEGKRWTAGITLPWGKGRLWFVGFDLGMAYRLGASAAARKFLHTVEAEAYDPIVRVTGSQYCDVTLLEKDGKLLLQLVNTAGGHGDSKRMTIDEIPPIGPLSVSIRLPKAPVGVYRRPGGDALKGEYRGGRFETVLDRLELYDILEIVQ